jgi:hypothetical protein
MASGSADDALSPPAISFVICGKTWKLGDPIHSTGIWGHGKKNGFKLSALLSPPQELKESFWVEGPVRNNA